MSYASPGKPSERWQRWVEEKPILSLAMVGVIATQLGTYFGYVFPAVGLPVLPWPLYNGILGTTLADGYNGLAADPNFGVTAGSFFVGLSIHFVNGIVFAVLWGILFREDVHRFIKHNVLNGMLYALIMTIISAGLLVPYAYVPDQGYGFFLFDGPDGWKLPFGILVWHLIYGVFLGLLWNPTDRVEHDTGTT
jgi:hypothetical protein